MEGRAFKNDHVDHFSEGACLPRWRVTRRKHRAESWYFSQKAVTSLTLTDRRERHGVQTVPEPESCHGAGF